MLWEVISRSTESVYVHILRQAMFDLPAAVLKTVHVQAMLDF